LNVRAAAEIDPCSDATTVSRQVRTISRGSAPAAPKSMARGLLSAPKPIYLVQRDA